MEKNEHGHKAWGVQGQELQQRVAVRGQSSERGRVAGGRQGWNDGPGSDLESDVGKAGRCWSGEKRSG